MKLFNHLYQDLEVCKQILKLFHPNCPDIPEDKFAKMCRPGNYDWQQIEGNVKGYGYIHLCMENGKDTTMTFGPRWSLQEFEKKIKAGALQFHIWRIINDCLSKSVDYSNLDEVMFNKQNNQLLLQQYTAILTNAGYRTKTAKEWHKHYFKD